MNNIEINDNYISLSVDLYGLPEFVTIKNNELKLKTSFHVSLACIKNITSQFGEDISQKMKDLFIEFNNKYPVTFNKYKDEFRFAIREADNRKSLVVMVEVNNLSDFFDEVRNKLNIEIDNQPTHITLYTLETDEGIGINNMDDLNNMTEVVTEEVPRQIKDMLK